MKYICATCRYTYDETLGDKWNEIEPYTYWWELWEYWTCPNCWSEKEFFHGIKEEILTPLNKDKMSNLEASHTPEINIKDDICSVNVWYISHPNWEWHYISSVSLYDEVWELLEEINLDIDDISDVEFDISYLDIFEIRAKCTIHGIWSSWIIERDENLWLSI